MKTQIRVEYRGKTYLSNAIERDAHELQGIISMIQQIGADELSYFNFKSGKKNHYFTSSVLKECVITIIES